ncbi:MAG: alpha-L-fucosidase, partial [Anaerolineae bacterium]
MSRSWYDTSYRKLFFDFHSPGTAAGLAAAFDAERWADRVQRANAQAVSVFTKGGYGYSFYRKGSIRYVHPHLPPGLDMLEEQIAALHERGIRAIGYYHTFNSEPVARDHPDWVERDADGQPRDRSICMLGPLAEEWMLPHIAEIVSLYDVDAMFFDGTYAHGVCHCPACRERYAEASGGLSLPRDETDPQWPQYVAWALQAYRELRQSICDVIHEHRPEAVVSFNWAYTQRQPEVVPEGVGALTADILPDDQSFNGSYLSRYWATLGRPFDIMNSAFLQWWGDWGCKPATAMQQEVATAIANGGLTWIG